MTGLVYYSSHSGNTARLVARVGRPALRIPIEPDRPMPSPQGAYILVCPTYADGLGRGAVPKQVIRFLNEPSRRALLRGVVAGGNRSFGATFALAGAVIAGKCGVPLLHKFELAGTDADLARLSALLATLTETPCLTTA